MAQNALQQSSAFHYERDPSAVRVPERYKHVNRGGAFGAKDVSPFTRTAEKWLSRGANVVWYALQGVNKILGEAKPFQPAWAPAPLLKSHQKTKPPLGWPRETDSLCPKCVKETRQAVIDGKMDV